MTPTIFFNLLIGLIDGFQVFEQVFILIGTHGGPLQAGLVYMLHVYNKAFRDFEFGYAAALSVVLVPDYLCVNGDTGVYLESLGVLRGCAG